MENNLLSESEKYRMLLEFAVDAFFQGDAEGNLIMVNDKACKLTGYTREELLRLNMRDLFSKPMMTEKPLRYDLLRNGETIITERDILTKTGSYITVEMNSNIMPDGTYQSFFRDITERKKAEKALIESEQKYRKLHNSMMDGFVYVNMEGTVIDSNESYQQMVGFTPAELAKLTYRDLTPKKWHQKEAKIVKNILLQGHSGVYEKEYIRKDGTTFPVELRTFLIRNEAGENEGMWALVRDITDRKRAETRIRESEEKFRSIVESSPTAMYFYRLEPGDRLVLSGANPAADRIIGISHLSLLGKTIEEAFPNLVNTEVPAIYKKIAKGEHGTHSFEIQYKDDRFTGYYSVYVFRTSPGAIAVDFIDITDRKLVEDALRRSEIEYRDTLDSIPDWVFVIDDQMRFVIINTSMREEQERQGYPTDCIGKKITNECLFITDNILDAIHNVFNTGIMYITGQKYDFDRKTFFCDLRIVPIFKDNKVVKVVTLIRDRSREKEAEDLKLRSAEQKEVLLREIHHRVKNNLAIVISLLNFQLRRSNDPELGRIIRDIQLRIRSMALIHEHLYRSENLDRIPLAAYIQSLSSIILSTFSGQRVRLETRLEPVDVTIETALPIGLIINELLTNAFKYAFPVNTQGEIRLQLEKRKGNLFTLTVKDNGKGLPPGFSIDSDKSLGMYIVRLLVEQLDGKVQIINEHGTTFNIDFCNIIPTPHDSYLS